VRLLRHGFHVSALAAASASGTDTVTSSTSAAAAASTGWCRCQRSARQAACGEHPAAAATSAVVRAPIAIAARVADICGGYGRLVLALTGMAPIRPAASSWRRAAATGELLHPMAAAISWSLRAGSRSTSARARSSMGRGVSGRQVTGHAALRSSLRCFASVPAYTPLSLVGKVSDQLRHASSTGQYAQTAAAACRSIGKLETHHSACGCPAQRPASTRARGCSGSRAAAGRVAVAMARLWLRAVTSCGRRAGQGGRYLSAREMGGVHTAGSRCARPACPRPHEVLSVDAWEIVSAVSAAISAAAAGLAWRAARESNRAAATLARIELERRHAELTPVLIVTCAENRGVTSQRLTVTFTGPPGLDHVDTLTVAIRDDSDDGARGVLPEGPSAEETRQLVWGPVRFVPGSGPGEARADETGRKVPSAQPLRLGSSLHYRLEPTRPPRWANLNDDAWRSAVGTVLRLEFIVTLAGHEPWTIPGELEIGGLLTYRKGPVKVVLPMRP
jgi:hypothetical protein